MRMSSAKTHFYQPILEFHGAISHTNHDSKITDVDLRSPLHDSKPQRHRTMNRAHDSKPELVKSMVSEHDSKSRIVKLMAPGHQSIRGEYDRKAGDHASRRGGSDSMTRTTHLPEERLFGERRALNRRSDFLASRCAVPTRGIAARCATRARRRMGTRSASSVAGSRNRGACSNHVRSRTPP